MNGIRNATGVRRIGSGVKGEWRVHYTGVSAKIEESTAYYTNNYDDAVATQSRMLEELKIAKEK